MILTISLIIICFAAYSVMYTLQFHYITSIFKDLPICWWSPALSWVNKYKSKDNRTPKFFGSTTFLVWTTDAFHLFQFIFINSGVLALAINVNWYSWYINFIIIRSVIALVWWVLFEWLLIKKY